MPMETTPYVRRVARRIAEADGKKVNDEYIAAAKVLIAIDEIDSRNIEGCVRHLTPEGKAFLDDPKVETG